MAEGDGFEGGPLARTPAGRDLDRMFLPPPDSEVRRALRKGEAPPVARQVLVCRGTTEPPAEVCPLTDELQFRLRTGDVMFDRRVWIRTPEPLAWTMALDPHGRNVIAHALRVGWTCIGDDWVIPWSPEVEGGIDDLARFIDAAIDALAPDRTSGRARWQACVAQAEHPLRRTQLVLGGAAAGWLPPAEASAALQREVEPLVRLALYTLFLPNTTDEVSAALRTADPEVAGLAAVSLANTRPRGALRKQVEHVLLRVIDHPIDGLFPALESVGTDAAIEKLQQRITGWRGPRLHAAVDLLASIRERLASGDDEFSPPEP